MPTSENIRLLVFAAEAAADRGLISREACQRIISDAERVVRIEEERVRKLVERFNEWLIATRTGSSTSGEPS